jgi:hypothetical protein
MLVLLAILGAAPPSSERCVQMRTAAPGWQSGDPGVEEPHTRVTHSYPRWPWPARYDSDRPVFLIRLNRVVDPERVLSFVHVASDERGWRQPQLELVRCLVERGHTTVVFRLSESLPPDTAFTWMLQDREWSFGQTERPENLNGSYLYNVFRTYDAQHPVGSNDPFWSDAQLVQTHGEALTRDELRRQAATLDLLRRLKLDPPQPASAPALTPVAEKTRDLCEDFNRNHAKQTHSRCPPCPCACNNGQITCAPCIPCDPTASDGPEPGGR